MLSAATIRLVNADQFLQRSWQTDYTVWARSMPMNQRVNGSYLDSGSRIFLRLKKNSIENIPTIGWKV